MGLDSKSLPHNLRRCVFSPCRKYRYTLWREWGDLISVGGGLCQFIGLNPSTADETNDDPTIRRCIQFSKDFGCSALCMTNLFAWRETDSKKMKLAADPVGPDNDFWICEIAKRASIVVAAWGNDGLHQSRSKVVCALVPNLCYLKINAATGEPSHPLYLSSTLRPIRLGT